MQHGPGESVPPAADLWSLPGTGSAAYSGNPHTAAEPIHEPLAGELVSTDDGSAARKHPVFKILMELRDMRPAKMARTRKWPRRNKPAPRIVAGFPWETVFKFLVDHPRSMILMHMVDKNLWFQLINDHHLWSQCGLRYSNGMSTEFNTFSSVSTRPSFLASGSSSQVFTACLFTPVQSKATSAKTPPPPISMRYSRAMSGRLLV